VAAAPAGSAIPYRTSNPVSAGTFAWALLATALLMAVAVGVLLVARRRGWITATAKVRSRGQGEDIALLSSRRLSAATTAYVVAYGGRAYLVVESVRGSVAKVLPLQDAGRDGEDGP
jgi:hypothetical protein